MKIYAAQFLLALGAASAFTAPAPRKESLALFSEPGSDFFTTGEGSSWTAAPPAQPSNALSAAASSLTETKWDSASTLLIQGNSLRTWPVANNAIDRVRLSMKTEGRPLNANIDLWHGPDYTPSTMKVYIEDGDLRPFNAVIETPQASNTVAVYNTGDMEFPFTACVEGSMQDSVILGQAGDALMETTKPKIVQGGAVATMPFGPSVESVQVLLKTDGRNLKARVELMQGPNNNKQVIEFYSSDGDKRPLFVVIETPGSGNVVRIVNQSPVEFPFNAYVAPNVISGDAI